MSSTSGPDSYRWNQEIWDRHVLRGQRWTRPASPEAVLRARAGDLSDVTLCASKPIPASWYPKALASARILCLAGGGGQQSILLAAAGAKSVVVYDASQRQLEQDRLAAARERFDNISCVQGDMRNLDVFEDASFDLIVHPVSNCFVPDILPVWRSCYRVLKPGGALLSGFNNPVVYSYDEQLWWTSSEARLVHSIPYSDLVSRQPRELERMQERGDALEFGHSLEEQIQGQCAVGFVIAGFYEDVWPQDEEAPEQFARQNELFPQFMATRALKLPISLE